MSKESRQPEPHRGSGRRDAKVPNTESGNVTPRPPLSPLNLPIEATKPPGAPPTHQAQSNPSTEESAQDVARPNRSDHDLLARDEVRSAPTVDADELSIQEPNLRSGTPSIRAKQQDLHPALPTVSSTGPSPMGPVSERELINAKGKVRSYEAGPPRRIADLDLTDAEREDLLKADQKTQERRIRREIQRWYATHGPQMDREFIEEFGPNWRQELRDRLKAERERLRAKYGEGYEDLPFRSRRAKNQPPGKETDISKES